VLGNGLTAGWIGGGKSGIRVVEFIKKFTAKAINAKARSGKPIFVIMTVPELSNHSCHSLILNRQGRQGRQVSVSGFP
jgi:hypothetical protein